MRLELGPDDDDGFIEARTVLLQRFEQWLTDRVTEDHIDAAEMADDAGLALDWKWGYGDGDLARWQTSDVAEFLLDWCPRKLGVSQDDCLSIPSAFVALMTFLETEGLLAPGSSTTATLAEATAGMSLDFVSAMGDPSNFGMAKSLFGAAEADGVDMSDPDQLQEWINEFNAGPEEDRRRIIPTTALSRPPRPLMPPVALPDDVEVAESKAAAPVLAMFAAFASYVGNGRKLTQTGNLTPADARALVELLETGDVIDAQIGDQTFKTQSSAELPRLGLIFRWARKAGVVRVVHGRVVATKQGLALSKNRAGSFDRAVDALMALGPLSSQRDPRGWMAWPDVNTLLDRIVLHLLTGPYIMQRPMPIDDLIQVAVEAVLDAFEFASLDDERVARVVSRDVVDIMDALVLAGMVQRADLPEPADSESTVGRRRHGGTVGLTDAGIVTTRLLLIDSGYDAPIAGRFAQLSATELFVSLEPEDFTILVGELEAWRRRRSPAQAAADLAVAVRDLKDPILANLALAVMADMDLDVAAPEVRRLATEPETRGFASCWLVDQGLEDPKTLFDPNDVSWFVDVLAQRLVIAGPDGLCDTLALAGSHDAQIEVIGRLWRSPSTATENVLAVIGDVHPTKVIAKAARKAHFQHRSRRGP